MCFLCLLIINYVVFCLLFYCINAFMCDKSIDINTMSDKYKDIYSDSDMMSDDIYDKLCTFTTPYPVITLGDSDDDNRDNQSTAPKKTTEIVFSKLLI